MSRQSTPGFAGVIGIVAATVGTSVLVTAVTGTVIHWVPVGGGILVGLWAVQSINKHR